MTMERKKTEKVGLRFSETMSGYLSEGVEDFVKDFAIPFALIEPFKNQELNRKLFGFW